MVQPFQSRSPLAKRPLPEPSECELHLEGWVLTAELERIKELIPGLSATSQLFAKHLAAYLTDFPSKISPLFFVSQAFIAIGELRTGVSVSGKEIPSELLGLSDQEYKELETIELSRITSAISPALFAREVTVHLRNAERAPSIWLNSETCELG